MYRVSRRVLSKRVLWIVALVYGLLVLHQRMTLSIFRNLGDVAVVQFLLNPTLDTSLSELSHAQSWLELEIQIAPADALTINRLQRVVSLRERYATPYFASPFEAAAIFERGVTSESVGAYEQAIVDYRHIINNVDASHVPAYYRLWRLYMQLGQEYAAKRVAERLYTLAPEYTIEKQEELKGWTLAGYQLEEMRLEMVWPLPVIFYWQAETAVCEDDEIGYWQRLDEELYCVRNKVYQLRIVENLVSVGEEIRIREHAGLFGFRLGNKEQIGSGQIRYTQRLGIPTNVFALTNDAPMENALMSLSVSVEPQTAYLLAGWAKTKYGNENAWLGVVCIGERWRDGQRYSYIFRKQGISEWKHFAGMIQTTESDRTCRVLLLNYGNEDEVRFDDILFSPIRPPLIP